MDFWEKEEQDVSGNKTTVDDENEGRSAQGAKSYRMRGTGFQTL